MIRYKSDGVASTDFGSFDASVTDTCTGDVSRDGIRTIVEEGFMSWLKRKFKDSADFANAADHRWKDKYHGHLRLISPILLPHSAGEHQLGQCITSNNGAMPRDR